MAAIRIIGLGNSFRGDDAVGLHVVRRMRELLGSEADVVEAEMLGVEVLELMKERELVILVDGACTGAPAGTVHRWDVSNQTPPQNPLLCSTHAINALDAIELARITGELPPCIIVYGVEIGQDKAGTNLSQPLLEAVELVARQIVQEVDNRAHA